MKKVLLSLGLLASVSFAAQAQSIKYGVKAGGSLTGFTGDDSKGSAYQFGFHAGVLANFGINDMFSVQPELLYSQKGAKGDGTTGNPSDLHANLNYIDVPVMLRIATGSTGLFFEAGPQVGFLASAKAVQGSNSADIKDNLKSVDFGYAAGLGYQIESGAMVGLRYNGAFTSAGKSTTVGNVTVESNTKNSAFQLYVGYMFGGK